MRVRIPRPPRTRQISPPVPFGEEGLLVEAVVPSDKPLPEEAWVSLTGWRILEQPHPMLLVADPVRGVTPPIEAARPFAAALGASIAVLGVVEEAKPPEALRDKLKSQFESEAAEIRIRAGHPAEQLMNEQAENFYDLAVIGALGRQAVRRAPLRRLLRESATPLLIGAPREKFERFLICTAVGEPGKSDIRVGGWLAGRMGARRDALLHVSRTPRPAAVDPLAPGSGRRHARGLRRRGRGARANRGLAARRHPARGAPGRLRSRRHRRPRPARPLRLGPRRRDSPDPGQRQAADPRCAGGKRLTRRYAAGVPKV